MSNVQCLSLGENADLDEDLQDSEKKAAKTPKPSLLCSGLFVMCIANSIGEDVEDSCILKIYLRV